MTLLCFGLFLAGIIVCLTTGRNLLWALSFGLLLFFLLGIRKGHSCRDLVQMAWGKGKSSLIVVPVFLLIGTVTALWRSSGTISFFLYHGLRGISPPWFILIAFLLSASLSFVLGTSNGVAGTAGVVLIALARSGGVDPAVTAGAILSGAYFGDRCSPMSSCASLVAACTGTDLYRNVREMLKTAALPTVLTILFYAFISFRNPITTMDEAVLSALSEHFSLHPVVLFPAVLMLLLPLFRVPVKWAMAASALVAGTLSVFLQGLPLFTVLKTALIGYVPTQEPLQKILSGGGLLSMVSTGAIVFITSLYAGILDGIDAFSPARRKVSSLSKTLGIFPTSVLVSTALVCVFCNQSIAILMGEQLLCDTYKKQNASRLELAMDIANSGVMIAGLIPWSIACTVPLSMLGVGAEAVPWAALLYLIPLCYLLTKPHYRAGQNLSFGGKDLIV